ncbi:hypothetical protein LSAT2_003461 [Lamellibrachia satsuma]|nr:hypothetical protein LSAT2_003461 [Lamellibrachia satsuma]
MAPLRPSWSRDEDDEKEEQEESPQQVTHCGIFYFPVDTSSSCISGSRSGPQETVSAPARPSWQPRAGCQRGAIKSGDAEREEPVRRRNHENCTTTFCSFFDTNMKCSQMNACLVLFLEALTLYGSYGEFITFGGRT